MNIQNKITELKDELSYNGHAHSVKQYLAQILSHSNKLRLRWMWELLQNASDLGENVKVKIEIDNDKLTYSHNGKNFSLLETYNLIRPNTSKDNEITKSKSVIGQFGTGFISTHILSKIIYVKGIIEDERKLYEFDFSLDRSERNDKDFLIQSIKDAEAELLEKHKELEELSADEFQTSFTYQIDNTYSTLNGQEIVNDGIESFKELIPYVLTFRPQLEEIEVIDQRTTEVFDERTTKIIWTFKRDEIESDIEELIIIKTICQKNGERIEDRLIGKIIEDETEIAFPIKEIEGEKYQLLPFPKNCPLLFCAFPMIGTSNFNFPVVINSEKFVPNRERDGIEISEYDTQNRDRLIEAKEAYLKLLGIIEDYEWTNAFNIAKLSNPEFNESSIKNWFMDSIFKPIKEGIHETKMVELDESLKTENKRRSLSKIYIPYADRRVNNYADLATDIYNFAFKTIPTILPKKEHFLNWFEILDFEIFTEEKLDIETLTDRIYNYGDVDSLEKFCSEYSMDEIEAIDFIVEFVTFIINQKEEQLFKEHKIILNQKNIFCLLKDLRLDLIKYKGLNEGFNEKLKDIYFWLSNTECREELLHKEFEQINNLINKNNSYTFKELAKETDEELSNYNGNYQDEDFLLILKDLFKWYTNCGLSNDTLMKFFPYFETNKSQLYLNTKTPQELEYAFDIEISGKSEVLAKLANSSLSTNELELIASNSELLSNFIDYLNSELKDDPDKELGDIGEEFLYHQLCQIFGEKRVLWERESEYDFRVLEKDLTSTKYFIDAKTTGKGIANSDNVPFFMRTSQWKFLDKQLATDKYIIARIFKSNETIDVKYLKLNKHKI